MVGSWVVRECAIGWCCDETAVVLGFAAVVVGVEELRKLGTKTFSFCSSDRFALTSLLNGVADKEPLRIGRMN